MIALLPRPLRVSFVAGAVGLIAALGVLLAPGHSLAQSVPAYASVNLNQRAGPGTRFPVIATAPVGTPVSLFGCLSDLSWCDGAFQGNRGWFSARYLQLPYQGGYLTVADYVRYAYLPIVSFNISSYWANYYPTRPFYAQLSLYATGGSVTVSIGSFYQPLSPLGSWVLIHERYVWVPRVAANWRPYTDGRWAYTRTQGWMWVSNEPFGWATYHYGRWAYSPTIGWFWVPGTQWAPAWVAWRQSDDYLAWAPLPPDPKDSLGSASASHSATSRTIIGRRFLLAISRHQTSPPSSLATTTRLRISSNRRNPSATSPLSTTWWSTMSSTSTSSRRKRSRKSRPTTSPSRRMRTSPARSRATR